MALMVSALAVIRLRIDRARRERGHPRTSLGVGQGLTGVVALAAATSLPNAYAAVRLATDGRGSAVVSATFKSNALNLVAGIATPILVFPSLRGSVPTSYVVWLLLMSLLALILLARGLRRGGALLLLSAYGAFVVYAILTA